MDQALAESGVPGAQAAAILADGSTWTAGAGTSAPDQPMTPDLLMAIASVTKVYTAALTLDLASDGLLSLDDPLDRWLPEAPHANGVTIRQLLTHTSGIASDDPALDPVCEPGTCHSYSNGGYRYLGWVIERASGETYVEALRHRILTPLGLESTFYPRQESTVGGLATGYGADGEMLASDAATDGEGPGWYGASGGLVATAADTARFAHELFSGSLLAPSALVAMLDFDQTRGLPGTDDCKGAGMNVWRHSTDLGESWYAGGNAGSFQSWVEHYPAQGVTIAAITNNDVPATGIVDALAREVLAGEPPAALGRCNTDIAVRSADGTVRLVTTDPGFDGFPSWSPDGRRLAWSGLRDGHQDILVADVDGSDELHLTDDEARDFFPRWSPDGTSIVFTSDRDGGLDLYVMAPDGSDIRQLTTAGGNEWLPAWSPDGTRIAYVSDPEGQRIRVMDADGSHDRAVTSGPRGATWPAWSPDGRRIAYESRGVILVVPVEGGDPVRLPLPQLRVTMHPAWAPGADIAFSSDGDLYATDEYGRNLRRLTATSTTEEVPAWAPDGSSMAFQLSHWDTTTGADASPAGSGTND
jgi:CubicO group peptidase (beta-lactamase class C family)